MTVKRKPQKKSKLRHAEYYDFQAVQDKLYAQSKKGIVFQNLLNLITLPENIEMAYRNLKKNDGSSTAGTDRRTIHDLAKLSQEKLIEIVKNKLRWYQPQSILRVEIPKGDGKMRPLGIPTIMDRLVQQCVLQVLEPICEAKFHEHSYGFRPDRNQEHAIAMAYRNMQISHLHYVVDIDIKSFFDNVSHGKLLKQLWTLGIRDKKLLSIISAMLKAEVAGIGFPEKGTPQGGIISPLLSNVVLNELDWWLSSQWAGFPTRHKYKGTNHDNDREYETHKFEAMRKTGLKEGRAVRYADDFKIFTKTRNEAERFFHATKDWLNKRLGLEISPGKSKIVNLRKCYSYFLGFKLKVIRRGKQNNGQPKYVVKSRVGEKAVNKIKEGLQKYIWDIEFPGHGKRTEYAAINRYNSYVLGVHNYYRLATCISQDMRKLAFPVQKSLKTRLGNRVKSAREVKKRKLSVDIPPYIKERYGDSKQLRFVRGHALIPIGYLRHKNPMNKRYDVTSYTTKGRELIHKQLNNVNVGILRQLMRNPVQNRSIEYNDNRLSLYAAQKGKCAVTGEVLEIGNIHCHHKIPRYLSGKDNYQNLMLVSVTVHKLIHAVSEATIQKYLKDLSLTSKQFKKLNELRRLANTDVVESNVI